jgi:hypothetical protein
VRYLISTAEFSFPPMLEPCPTPGTQSPWVAGDGIGNGDEMVTCVILPPALRSASSLTVALSSLFR